MNVADFMSPARTRTSIEEEFTAKGGPDQFEYVEPSMTTAAEQSSLDRLLNPHGRREFTRCAVVMACQPVAGATSPPAFQGEVKDFARPYWLTIALTEPLATVTLTSFEVPFRCPPPSSPWRELVDHFVSRPEVQVPSALRGRSAVEARPELVLEPVSELGETRAYRAFVELASWLGRTQAETADLLEIGRTTPLAWEREGHEPQPARARRLYQTHALVRTLQRRLGREEMRRWMESGDPSPLDLIAAGDVQRADNLADELIFGTAPGRERLTAWVDEEVTDTAPPTARPSQDRPRRVRRRPPRRRAQ